MESWTTVWHVVLIVTACAFFPLAAVVIVGGIRDIASMFRDLLAEEDDEPAGADSERV